MTQIAQVPIRSVQRIPDQPVMIYDGDCRFCRLWIGRWQEWVGSRVRFVPYQDPWVSEMFPDLPRAQYERSVQYIDAAGQVSTGARAAWQCLATSGRPSLGWWAYRTVPGFASLAEIAYRFVADHRRAFSFLTRLGWGEQVGCPRHVLVQRAFMILIALVYACAFTSMGTQILGLAGAQGVMPAAQTMETLTNQAEAEHLGLARYWRWPTLFWWSTSDGFLEWVCGGGVVLSLLVLAGVAPRLNLALLWLFYLSLLRVCPLFLGYQWDTLLLETGLLAAFFAPAGWWTWGRTPSQPSRVVLWLLRWLLFRLMFASGCVKLLSGDPAWHGLSALAYHYETQPLPTWIGWYAHHWPAWAQKTSVLLMFGIELVVPFAIFLPRRLRMLAAWPMIGLMVLIALTGNYCFFNVLTLTLCLTLFDDAGLLALAPVKLRPWLVKTLRAGGRAGEGEAPWTPVPTAAAWRRWGGKAAVGLLATIIILMTGMQFSTMFRAAVSWPGPASWIYRQVAPFASVNQYGLFAVMTTNRMEIVIEGSRDGQDWKAYEFRYKPGALDRRPSFVAPHQPRLDWQMWFAALSSYRNNPWLIGLCVRLLEGAPHVLGLLEQDPFPESPPKYIRAAFYEYHFTTPQERAQSGHWWRRQSRGLYLPPFSLPP